MDASKIIQVAGDPTKGIDQEQAYRMAMALQLRDMADEIEGGKRNVLDWQTFEKVALHQTPCSILQITSTLTKPPNAKEKT